MPEEHKKIELTLGTKVEKPPEGQEVQKGQKTEVEGEVSGKYSFVNYVVCPYCYATNKILEETTVVQYYQCWNCGYSFTK